MRRREFMTLAAASAAWPLAASGQGADPTRRIGALLGLRETRPLFQGWLSAFSQELTKLVATDPFKVLTEARWTNADTALAHALAAEMVASKPEVILAATTSVTRALIEETKSIPIVFVLVADAIGPKFVASLSRPGGNVTGFLNTEPSLGGKCLALLKEAAPGIRRAALMFNPLTAPGSGMFFKAAFDVAAKALDVEPLSVAVHNVQDIRMAVTALSSGRDGLILMDDSFITSNFQTVIEAVMSAKIPTISVDQELTAAGCLLSYFTEITQFFIGAAGYVHRILRGEIPADLPVQTPNRYRLAVNLKTAKSLGLEISPALLAAADEVIE